MTTTTSTRTLDEVITHIADGISKIRDNAVKLDKEAGSSGIENPFWKQVTELNRVDGARLIYATRTGLEALRSRLTGDYLEDTLSVKFKQTKYPDASSLDQASDFVEQELGGRFGTSGKYDRQANFTHVVVPARGRFFGLLQPSLTYDARNADLFTDRTGAYNNPRVALIDVLSCKMPYDGIEPQVEVNTPLRNIHYPRVQRALRLIGDLYGFA